MDTITDPDILNFKYKFENDLEYYIAASEIISKE